MNAIWPSIEAVLTKYSLVTAFTLVGAVVWVAYAIAGRLAGGRLHGSAIAILMGLAAAYVAGSFTGGAKGVADIGWLAGVGLMGGAMLRDLAIVATAYGVRLEEFIKTGLSGVVSLLLGVFSAFLFGATVAYAFGFRDPVALVTIGGGAATYIVGPVTGTALGASSDIIALSVGAGLVKSVLVMTLTPLAARWIGLDNPRAAMIYGGLLGTTSGVAGGLAATDERLVPYGAMTATFYTGLGCLLGPSVAYIAVRAVVGS
ncbi:Malonate/sodium symporter MadM subunit [Posidoniimonas polymericola]|uniref:Malonate/sodium symporter MadM subunit n=1 Tax=Posidoniimonas polymericola TaxID=2528002 RepID=A0A5C5YT25_9BACT|nr:malonate transporter subunit MadM [Posidoniimonas polymericola]TWT78129.1 Malonate/sodium symporter MadM subunit [Posidoniimonas polymericola]